MWLESIIMDGAHLFAGKRKVLFLNADISEISEHIVLAFGVCVCVVTGHWSGKSAKLFYTSHERRHIAHVQSADCTTVFPFFARSFGYNGVLQVIK